jgi:hypothetical protein
MPMTGAIAYTFDAYDLSYCANAYDPSLSLSLMMMVSSKLIATVVTHANDVIPFYV